MTNEEVFAVIAATVKSLVTDRGVPPLQVLGALHAVAVKGLYALGDQPEAVAMMQGAIVDFKAILAGASVPPKDRPN